MNMTELEPILGPRWEEFIIQNEDRDGNPLQAIHTCDVKCAMDNVRGQMILGFGLYGGEGGTFDIYGERRRIYCIHMRSPGLEHIYKTVRQSERPCGNWDDLQKYRVDDGEERGMDIGESMRAIRSKIDLTRILSLDRDGYVERIVGFADPILANAYAMNMHAIGYEIFKEGFEFPGEMCRTYCVYMRNPNESCPNPLFSAPVPECGAN